jgi:hypothetical protein
VAIHQGTLPFKSGFLCLIESNSVASDFGDHHGSARPDAWLPFPIGLRRVSLEAPAQVPQCWGVNGFFTVIGSIAAMIVGMTWGFNFALALGALSYACSALIMARTSSRDQTRTRTERATI